MPSCPQCGAAVNQGQPFCHSCGQSLTAAAWKSPLQPPGDEAPAVPAYIRANAPSRYGGSVTDTRPRRTDGGAIASMILGIVGLVMVPVIASIIALTLGYPARRRIQESRSLEGEGFATAGIVMGWIGVVLGIVVIIAIAIAASNAPEIADFQDPFGPIP